MSLLLLLLFLLLLMLSVDDVVVVTAAAAAAAAPFSAEINFFPPGYPLRPELRRPPGDVPPGSIDRGQQQAVLLCHRAERRPLLPLRPHRQAPGRLRQEAGQRGRVRQTRRGGRGDDLDGDQGMSQRGELLEETTNSRWYIQMLCCSL